jgi:hypothetical protein
VALREAFLEGVLLAMAYDPLFIVFLVVFLIVVLLTIFTFFTYLFLKMAVNLRRAQRGKK